MTQLKLFLQISYLALALLWPGLAAASDYATGEMALGPEDAKVTIIEYASMTCPHCAAFHADTFKKLKAEYIDTGKVRFVFREFPLDNLALRAAMLARCSGKDSYFAMVDVLFSQQSAWSRAPNPMAALATIGRLAGIDTAHFDACMTDQALMNLIVQNRMIGANEHQVESTPSFIVGGERITGSQELSTFESVIDKHLQ